MEMMLKNMTKFSNEYLMIRFRRSSFIEDSMVRTRKFSRKRRKTTADRFMIVSIASLDGKFRLSFKP